MVNPQEGLRKHNERKKAFLTAPKGLEVALRVANGIPIEYRMITRGQLMGADWPKLVWLIETLALELQAFCVHDGLEVNGETYFLDDEDWQIAFNLFLTREDETKLRLSVEDGFARINVHQDKDRFVAMYWVDRVRQRILLAFAVRQLIHCMAHPDNLDVDGSTDLYDESLWSWARFRIRKGKVKFEPSVLIRLLEGVEIERVRECPVCFKYFWAGRINMRCCSTPHANVLRMREYRKLDKVSYERKY